MAAAGVGIKCSVSGNRIAVCRRPSVALLWEHVGTKS
jgi:hypothetical protein